MYVVQEVVKLLAEQNAAVVNAQDIECQTPLHVIAANNSVESFHCLLAFIDDINVTDSARRTALHYAAYNGHTQVYRIHSGAAPLKPGACVKFSRNKLKRQPIGMLGRSSGNHDWLRAKRKRLRFLRFSFTQRTQRKRLRLNGNRA